MSVQHLLQPEQQKKIRAGGKPGRTDPRGNSKSRRARKTKLLNDPRWGGNGKTVPCRHCGKPLDDKSVEQDRIKPGGPYAYHNIQPACRECNLRRSNNPDWKFS